jgi:hypothetical protein
MRKGWENVDVLGSLLATTSDDDGHEKLPKDGQIAARWRP